jgi:hypothetical protein
MKKYIDEDNIPLIVIKNQQIYEDNIPLYIIRRNLIRKQMVIESNKKHLKEKNRNMYVMNGIIKSNITNSIVKFDETKNMIKTF